MKVHHVGYAVKSIAESLPYFHSLGYIEEGKITYDDIRNINIMFMINGSYRIELIESADAEKESPIDSWLKLQKGAAVPYHMCYEVANIKHAIAQFEENRFILVQRPERAPAINNSIVAFLFKKQTGLVEIIESE